ncbi:hypothetical protein PCASD_20056 [Puccinia coronata f. sp. avenae]|uniref:Uncharacterized protein n=1 Tax=Puccinia coronata f. sp. avenae TaxID=200324 RepID=A0A2N5TPC1_9BASI|nr:hypothetical protein PCASD_20056 [Puccinia coronata f. sp. avenae]
MSEQPTAPKQPADSAAARESVPLEPVTVNLLARMFEAIQPAKKLASITGINRAIALADALSKYQKLGKAIKPKLSEDGENSPDWRALLENTVRVVLEVWGYFNDMEVDGNPDRGKLIH